MVKLIYRTRGVYSDGEIKWTRTYRWLWYAKLIKAVDELGVALGKVPFTSIELEITK